MIQSMTGYSRITVGTVTVELRSTNHRYLEISQRMSNGLAAFEGPIAQLVRSPFKRGRIELTATVHAPKISTKRVVIDPALAKAYTAALTKLKAQCKLKGAVTVEQLLACPQVVTVVDEQRAQQAVWPVVRQAVQTAVRELLATRRAEGQRLVKDIHAQAQLIRRRVQSVRAQLPKNLVQQQRRWHQRLKGVMGPASGVTLAQVQEALAMVKEVDINEEIVRLDSHLVHLQQVVAHEHIVGKKLDFIAQELMREANTLGAKVNDAALARSAVEIKGAIEKIREQVQNLE